MPKIGELQYKRIDLITSGAWVEVLTNPKADKFNETQADSDNATGQMLCQIITKWNFTDDAGVDAPITPENVTAALSRFDVMKIFTELGIADLLLSEAKKNSFMSTSSPTGNPTPQSNTQS